MATCDGCRATWPASWTDEEREHEPDCTDPASGSAETYVPDETDLVEREFAPLPEDPIHRVLAVMEQTQLGSDIGSMSVINLMSYTRSLESLLMGVYELLTDESWYPEDFERLERAILERVRDLVTGPYLSDMEVRRGGT